MVLLKDPSLPQSLEGRCHACPDIPRGKVVNDGFLRGRPTLTHQKLEYRSLDRADLVLCSDQVSAFVEIEIFFTVWAVCFVAANTTLCVYQAK